MLHAIGFDPTSRGLDLFRGDAGQFRDSQPPRILLHGIA
jgi:hypothetical protein